jgi:protein-S-isoprenylcysteine O-methyltransferase Ste14
VLAIIAGIPLLLWGLVWTIGGAVVLVFRSLLDQLVDTSIADGTITAANGNTLRDIVVVVAVVVLIIGILQLLAAIGIWAHKGWGRWLGIIFGVLGTLFGLAALVGVRATPGVSGSRSSDLGSALFILVPYAFVLIAMVIGGAHFRTRRNY